VCGLYAVLWSKGIEMKKRTQLLSLKINIEHEALELVVSNPDKCIQSNKAQTNAIENVNNGQ